MAKKAKAKSKRAAQSKKASTKKAAASTSKKGLTKPPRGKKKSGAPFNEQDPKRRLGNFVGAGEHARQGSRTAGIVGQTKQRNHTDRRSDS
jgi:hypothetical protein